ncbi:MAG: hypothetical protein AAB879_01900 [Patescibacteria group bacterium]
MEFKSEAAQQRANGIRHFTPHAVAHRLKAEKGFTDEECQRVLKDPHLVLLVKTAILREISRAWQIPPNNAYVKRAFKSSFATTSADVRPSNHAQAQSKQLVYYWVDPVCYVVDPLSGVCVATLLTNDADRRLIECQWLGRTGKPPTIAQLNGQLQASDPVHPDTYDSVPDMPSVSVSRVSLHWRLTPHIPRLLTQQGAHLTILVAEEDAPSSDSIFAAIEHLGEMFEGNRPTTIFADPDLPESTSAAVAECLTVASVNRLPVVPDIDWAMTGKHLPKKADQWWEELYLLSTIPKNGKILAVMGCAAVRTLLEILLGSENAPWRRIPDLFASGTILKFQWADRRVPQFVRSFPNPSWSRRPSS